MMPTVWAVISGEIIDRSGATDLSLVFDADCVVFRRDNLPALFAVFAILPGISRVPVGVLPTPLAEFGPGLIIPDTPGAGFPGGNKPDGPEVLDGPRNKGGERVHADTPASSRAI